MLTTNHFLNQDHVEVRSYSGRGMYGKECLAIVGSKSDCMKAIFEVIKAEHHKVLDAIEDMVEDDFENPDLNYTFDDLLDELQSFQQDSMGRSDVVFYWPDVEYDLSSDEEDDEEEID